MKIGIVCPYNLFRPGGVQEHVLAEQRYLRERGHTVVLITPQPRSYKELAPDGIVFFGQSAKWHSQTTSFELSAAIDLKAADEFFEHEQFDIVQFHEPLIPFMPRQLLGRCPAIKVGTFHAAVADTAIAKSITGSFAPFFKSVVKQLDEVTAVSPAATEYIKDYVEDQYVTFIPNGIDLKQYVRDTSIPRSKSTILFVGRLEKRKGVAYLIQAMAELQKTVPHAQLLIAGDGPDREKLEMLAQDLEVKHIKFLGFISNEEKRRLMQECAVFCAPAIYGESFGIVVLEAMTMGAPVVAGDNPGYSFVLRERGMSGLVNPKDTIDFARRLKWFLTDEEFCQMWTNWSKDYVQKFSYQNVIDQYERLFTSLLNK